MPRTLFIDADACPVTRESIDCARRAGVAVVIAGNSTQNLERHIRRDDPRDDEHARRGFWVTTLVVVVAGFGWIVEGVMSILESELSSNRALAILSGALSIIAGMFVFIYPLWSAKMLVIFSGAALLVFGVTLIVRAIRFGKLVH